MRAQESDDDMNTSPTLSASAQEGETLDLHQANERTMLAWVRTGISLMAFGFAIARFGVFLRQMATAGHVDSQAPGALDSGWVGAVLVAVGMLVNLTATIRYGRIYTAIERGDRGAPNATLVYIIGATATLIGLVMTILLARALG